MAKCPICSAEMPCVHTSGAELLTYISNEMMRNAVAEMDRQMAEMIGSGWQFYYVGAAKPEPRWQRRLRYLRREAAYRLSTALAVLRGRHDCYC